jgi:mutator protein MutT
MGVSRRKIDNGESPEQAIVREIEEEFQIKVKVHKSFETYIFTSNERQIKFYPILCTFNQEEIFPTEHGEFMVINIIDIEKYELAPPDYEALTLIKNYDMNSVK